ncbi:MAG: translocation/assembly module TamB domain-containing protein, partial [Methanomicrobiales archaeon]
IKILGTFEKPFLSGQIRLMRTEFKINYLNVSYTLSDVVKVDSNSFDFNKIVLFDSLGNKAILNGKITHHYFRDMRLGLKIDLNDFSAFNNSRAQNNIFYGVARGSGTVNIDGPIENISIRVKAQTGSKTHVVIPINMTESIGQNDYIIFIQPSKDSVDSREKIRRKTTSGITLDLGILVNPNAEVEVYFPDQLGNLKATGTGNLQMHMTPNTPFTLSGIYFLKKGSFLFQLKNILRLPMSIKEGSQISWTGDPADANLSVAAVYKTKAPMKGLTSDPKEEGIRIPVECIIRLKGKLMNPDISFGMNLPNVEENIRTQVFSVIDTNNASEMTQQVVYLMVMNQFKPIISTSGSSVDVGSTSMSLVTNQINSWLSQISQNVNVGINYRPGTSTTQQEFDVALSTQLFDDRLLIDGTFGMNSYNNQTYNQSSTIVGDINIEYLLTKNRRWRVHAFNRTNTLTILNNNSQYTQGVGITYQRDFTNFWEIFRSAKKKNEQ